MSQAPNQPDKYEVLQFERMSFALDPDSVFPRTGPQRGAQELSIADLRVQIKELEANGLSPHPPIMVIHRKFSIPAACLVFALIGPKESDQLLEVMAATSELLAIPPADAPAIVAKPAEPGIVASESGAAVAVQPLDGGLDAAGGTTVPAPAGTTVLPVTPAVVVEQGVSNSL